MAASTFNLTLKAGDNYPKKYLLDVQPNRPLIWYMENSTCVEYIVKRYPGMGYFITEIDNVPAKDGATYYRITSHGKAVEWGVSSYRPEPNDDVVIELVDQQTTKPGPEKKC